MADDRYEVLLDFVSETAQAEQGTDALIGKIEKTEKSIEEFNKTVEEGKGFPADELSADFEKFSRAFDKTFKNIDGKMVDMRDGSRITAGEFKKFANSTVAELDKITGLGGGAESATPKVNPNIKKEAEEISAAAKDLGLKFKESFETLVSEGKTAEQALEHMQGKFDEAVRKQEEQVISSQAKIHTTTARVLRAQAAIIRDQLEDTRRNIGYIKQVGQGLEGISKIGLGVGVGLVGGAFAFAAKYVRDAKESTAVTLQWKAAQESLARSSARVGEVVAGEVLPLLIRASTIAEKAAQFAERNPDLIRAAINVGLITASVSAVGLLVSKGIKLYADVAYLATVPIQLQAAQLQSIAAKEQLIAAKLRASGARVDIPGGGGAAGGAASLLRLGPLAAILSGAAAFTAIGTKASQAGANAFGYDSPVQFWEQLADKIKNSNPALKELIDNIQGLTSSSGQAAVAIPTGVRASPEFENILKAYEGYLSDQKEMEAKFANDRRAIHTEANAAIARSDTQFATNRARIVSRRDDAIDKANRDFAQSEQQAERDNNEERAQIVREGGEEVVRIEQELQETLRKNSLEHEARNGELLAARDAVGLLNEKKRFNQQQAEARRDANLEVAQHRQDIAQRLEDNAKGYEQERTRRLEDHQQRVAEIQEQAAQDLQELRAQHTEEVKEIRKNRANRIRELNDQFIDERKRRYQMFIQQIRDLDASLLGEKRLRDQYQKQMILDLDKFLATYKAGLSTLAGAAGRPSRATGGYAGYGTYLLGDSASGGRGKPEYVLGGDLTELAERVLGSGLTQNKFAELLNGMGGNGKRNNITYNDNRRTNSALSSADRERQREETLLALSEVLA